MTRYSLLDLRHLFSVLWVAAAVTAPVYIHAQVRTGWYDHLKHDLSYDYFNPQKTPDLVNGFSHGELLAPYDDRIPWKEGETSNLNNDIKSYLEMCAANQQKVLLHIPRQYVGPGPALSDWGKGNIEHFVNATKGYGCVIGYIAWDEPTVGGASGERGVAVLQDLYNTIKSKTTKTVYMTLTIGDFESGAVSNYKNCYDRWLFDRYVLQSGTSEWDNMSNYLASQVAADKYASQRGRKAQMVLQACNSTSEDSQEDDVHGLRYPKHNEFRYLVWASKVAAPERDRLLYAHHYTNESFVNNIVKSSVDALAPYDDNYTVRWGHFFPPGLHGLTGIPKAAYEATQGGSNIMVDRAWGTGHPDIFVRVLKHQSQNKWLVIAMRTKLGNQEVYLRFTKDYFGNGKSARKITVYGNGDLQSSIPLKDAGSGNDWLICDGGPNDTKHNFGSYEIRAWIVE